uniref:Uncharacterized protein n=1 Tax=Chlamydomonas euryale TaxID=1486919 RepID=A0A7R9VDD5_9CHLO|mmetsp:Transcript_32343/g.96567  ORF Transcript_32343/g.96567 Transcript_32343/m.96567 type:complete len:103 (+) Transcript_32343:190-498(+)|eukprot:362721-Chlamydomonas_euryale.AAC.12
MSKGWVEGVRFAERSLRTAAGSRGCAARSPASFVNARATCCAAAAEGQRSLHGADGDFALARAIGWPYAEAALHARAQPQAQPGACGAGRASGRGRSGVPGG